MEGFGTAGSSELAALGSDFGGIPLTALARRRSGAGNHDIQRLFSSGMGGDNYAKDSPRPLLMMIEQPREISGGGGSNIRVAPKPSNLMRHTLSSASQAQRDEAMAAIFNNETAQRRRKFTTNETTKTTKIDDTRNFYNGMTGTATPRDVFSIEEHREQQSSYPQPQLQPDASSSADATHHKTSRKILKKQSYEMAVARGQRRKARGENKAQRGTIRRK